MAREVGTEDKLGGQASVEGVAGTWKDLTDNVNQLADNLTTQMRAIADVATTVTRGDLTRSIQVQATRRIVHAHPEVRGIGLSMHDSAEMARTICDAGAVSYLNKAGPPDQLVAAIRTKRQVAKS